MFVCVCVCACIMGTFYLFMYFSFHMLGKKLRYKMPTQCEIFTDCTELNSVPSPRKVYESMESVVISGNGLCRWDPGKTRKVILD